ncbi:MAG: polysaccharide deacetylase family protein [Actinomycetota bacterium]
MGRRAVRVVGVLAVAVLALGACGGEPDTPRESPTATAAPSGEVTSPTSSPRPTPSPAPPTVTPSPVSPAPQPSPAPSTRTAPPPAPAPSPVPLACAGVDAERLGTSEPVVALTVDLGGDAAGVPSILRTLDDHDVPATFFVTGAWARRYPDQLRQIAAAYPVGNHTDTHPQLTRLTDAQVSAELATVEQQVVALTGRTTKPLFRFPFGDRDARTIAAVNRDGYCAYRWTVDTLGWKGTSGGVSAQTVVDRVLAAARPGEIVLMHGGANPDDGTTLDADALPTVIRELRARGYSFVPLPR